MYFTKDKIYLNPGEDIISFSNDGYLKLQTKYYDDTDLFVNNSFVELHRDEKNENIHRFVLSSRSVSEDNLKNIFLASRLQKVFYRTQLEFLKQLYLSYQIYGPANHFVEKFVLREEEIVIPAYYSSVDIRDTASGSWVTCMNTETIVVNQKMEYGVPLSLQDQELIRRLEKRKK